MPETNAQIILGVAEAIGAHLEMFELLAALNEKLKPIIYFDAIGIGVLEDEVLRIYSIHLESTRRVEGESLESLMDRHAPETEHPLRLALSDHPVSEMMHLVQPYVCADVETQRRFGHDEHCLEHGFRSYISLPLIKQGDVIGVIEFLSNQTGNYRDDQVGLLQDIAKIVAIAVANALAYEQIRSLKEQLALENRVLQEEIVERSIYEEIVGSSSSLHKVLAAIEKVAPTDSTVLITGETGTRKELLAHAIHWRSPRCERALVKMEQFPSDIKKSTRKLREYYERLGFVQMKSTPFMFLSMSWALPSVQQLRS